MKRVPEVSKNTPLSVSLMAALLVCTLAACSSNDDDGSAVITGPGTVIVPGDSVAGDGEGNIAVTADPGAVFALTNRHDPSIQISAPADVTPEPELVNEVVAFSRSETGVLEQIGVFETGGLGENIRASGANPLASQDPLIVSKDNRFLFAVNAGSESISSFVINDDFTLTPATLDISTTGVSNAQNPVSLTILSLIHI